MAAGGRVARREVAVFEGVERTGLRVRSIRMRVIQS